MILKLVRTPGIYLVGFMGCGKSTIGRLLADRLGWTFIDLDDAITAQQNATVAQIFETHGEEYFRQLETEALRKHLRAVRSGRPLVMALGGGAFVRPENFEMLEDNGVSVWLDVPIEIAWKRASENNDRPLARDVAKFAELYESRRPVYERADIRIEVGNGDPGAVVDAICALSIFH